MKTIKLKISKDELRKKLDIKDGYMPIKGKDYFDGEQGPRGFAGKNGRDGLDGKDIDKNEIIQEVISKIPKPKDGKDSSPDTAQQIIDKIKGLFSYKDLKDTPEFRPQVKPSGWLGSGYIRELSDFGAFLNDLKTGAISVGGVEEITTIAGTSIYTLSHTPKYITFNGQNLYKGHGYSLSGLTITLDLTPTADDLIRSHY